jgi:hypothetical protein
LIFIQREYEEFKVRINALVAKAQKVPEEGWTMQDGSLWPGNNVRDHPGMIQVGVPSPWCAIIHASTVNRCHCPTSLFVFFKLEVCST